MSKRSEAERKAAERKAESPEQRSERLRKQREYAADRRAAARKLEQEAKAKQEAKEKAEADRQRLERAAKASTWPVMKGPAVQQTLGVGQPVTNGVSHAPRALPEGPVYGPTTGDVLCAWAEQTLVVPSGLLQGESFNIEEWQRAFIVDTMQAGVRDSILCTARKNGKTGLVALLVLAYLVGPLNRPNQRLLAVSLDGKTATALREAVRQTAEASNLNVRSLRTPQPGRFVGDRGCELQLLASDKATGQAEGADVAIIDEAGLMPENQREVWDGIRGTISARAGRVICISVQGDGPMFEQLRNMARAEYEDDEGAYVLHEYVAEEGCDVMDEAQWEAANPGLGTIKDRGDMRHKARQARSNPADEQGFRAFQLNQAVDPEQVPLLSIQQYRALVAADEVPRKGPWLMGVDVGGGAAMTAVAAYWPESGRAEVYAGVPSVKDGAPLSLKQRSSSDGLGPAVYPAMAAEGSLSAYPSAEAPVEPVVRELLRRVGTAPARVLADTYRSDVLAAVMERMGVRAIPELRRPGWDHGAEDVGDFQAAVNGGRVWFSDNLLLRVGFRHSVMAIDKHGRAMLTRSKRRGPIDVIAALTVAVAAGERRQRRGGPGSGRTYGGKV